jgi:HD-GYP domain-containing protein (c-di-GMP phosphodiesterase class II)/sensor domain CHASE-containing protein
VIGEDGETMNIMKRLGALSIQTRVVLLVGVLAWAMAISVICALFLAHRQADVLSQHTQTERATFYGKLMTLRGARMKAITFDYTYWDDMVTFVKKPTRTWAANNLDTALGTYDVDILWVFDPSMHQVYSTSGDHTVNLKTAPLTLASRRFITSSGPFYHFFVKTKNGLMEVYGGSIHASDDVAHTGPAKGYLFVGRIWDTEYLNEIRGITASRITKIVYGPSSIHLPKPRTEYDTTCNGWNGEKVATLVLVGDDSATTLLERSINRFLFMIAVFSVLLVAAISNCLYAWVTRPLSHLSKAMREQSVAAASELLTDRAEIGGLAHLMTDFFNQKAELKIANELLEVRVAERTAEISESNKKLMAAYDATIDGWSRALDLRDHETEGHSRRVTAMTLMLGRSFGLNEAELLNVERGAMLHDIGKMAIPDSILLKPGPLSDEEWTVMRRHPQFALEMLQSISFLENSLDIPYCHHEKWDGTGYPHGLREEEIPFAARMFAIADVWDALSSDRPYRPAWPISKVREHCKSLSGTHFDPQIVEMLLELTQVDEPETPLKLAA